MNCDWQDAGESQYQAGFRRYVCTRAGCRIEGHSPYGPERVRNAVNSPCPGWPHLHEWGHWCALLLEAVFIRKALIAWLNYRLGLTEVPKCNCEARERWLNTLGGKLCSSPRWWAKRLARVLVRRLPDPPDLPGVPEV